MWLGEGGLVIPAACRSSVPLPSPARPPAPSTIRAHFLAARSSALLPSPFTSLPPAPAAAAPEFYPSPTSLLALCAPTGINF